MAQTASFLIFVIRVPGGYVASCPAFPRLRPVARSGRVAYARLKLAIKADLAARLAAGSSVPQDPVVQAKTLRIDLSILAEEEDLR